VIADKPGIRTTEFQLAVLNVAVSLALIVAGALSLHSLGWMALGLVATGALLLGGTYWAYASARAAVKGATIETMGPPISTRTL
jgi:Na+/proline symporter